MNTERPLDGLSSIKVKLAVLVTASIVVAAVVSQVGDRAGVPAWLTVPVTVVAALGATQWLARGMTSPLREMTDAAARMATGDHTRRVTASSSDEVGALAVAFNTMAADLASADQQRRQLVATVSHELRTPLAAQQALLENLVDGVVRPDDEVLRAALAQAERLGALVGDLLDLSRVDGGPDRLVLAPVRVADLLDRAVGEAGVGTGPGGAGGVGGVGGARGVRHVVSLAPADLTVTADAARLAQVLANLLDNAARHSPAGGTVTVSAGLEEGPGPGAPDRWWLEVADEGPGIPIEHARRVFDRFGSGDDAGGGTGIGLAIASWVCELHGGSIAVLPADPGEPGARVRAVLPRRPGAAAETPTTTPPTTTPPTTTPPTTTPPTGATDRPAPPEEPAMSTPVTSAAGSPALPRPVPPPGPLVDSVFGDLWPETGLAPQPRMLLAALGVGILSAVLLPYRNLGIALFTVLVVGGAVLWRATPRRREGWTVASAAVCVALASLAVLRAADWLMVLAVLVGLLVTATTLTGARGVPALVAGVVSWPLAALRGLPLLGRTIAATSRVSILWPVVRTAAISLVALVVFGGLFASGDAVFGSWASHLVPQLAWDSLVFRFFVGFVMGGALLAAGYLALNPPRVDRVVLPAGRPVGHAWEWLVPVGLVVAVFLAFVGAQAAALFGGHDYVRRTTGLTYADYVHQGFGQLTAATLLTLATVAVTVRKAPRESPHDRLVLRTVLGALCTLTLVVVGSALHRIDLYQQAYGFTVLRLLVVAFELFLGLLVLLVLVAGVRLEGGWLPRAAVMAAAAFVLVGGALNPEAWVAQRNIDRWSATGDLDVAYLATLGPDAAPTVVAGLPREVAVCIAGPDPAAGDDALAWNLGRSRASALDLAPATPTEVDRCRDLRTSGLHR